MGVISWIKKKFFKEENFTIVNISDTIKIPTRDFFKDDISKLNLIDNYKVKYLKVLSKKKLVTTLDLDSNNLKKDMVMVIDLLLHNIFLESDISSLAREELLIQKLKLKSYYDEINSMYINTVTRLIALKELYAKRLVPRRNRMCLVEEINQLSNSLVIFLSQQSSIIKELKAYLALLDISNNDIDIPLLDYRYNKLLFISSNIINNKDLDKLSNIESKIAYIETIFEKYTYQNKDEISRLRVELEKLFNIPKDRKNKNKLLEQVINLEKKFLMYYEYGINLVTEEDINKIYQIKFDILVCDIDYLRKSPIDKNDYGFEYYKKIIFKKLETIILGKNYNLNHSFTFGGGEYIFKKYYKDVNSNEYDLNSALLEKYKLNLLVCFDRENGFNEMLSNNVLLTMMKEEDRTYFEKLLEIPGIIWEDKAPITSILSLIDEECNHPLYWMFKQKEADLNFKMNYLLPEGIKSIDGNLLPEKLKNKIKKESRSMKIVFPCSLEKINGEIFDYEIDDFPINVDIFQKYKGNVILNDGLQEIGEYVFKGLRDTSITIPSSVSKIDYRAFIDTNLKTIVFDDYKNSIILNVRYKMQDFLEMFFRWKETGRIGYYNRGKIIFVEGSEADLLVKNFSPNALLYQEMKLVSNLENIILKNGKQEISIDLKEISMTCARLYMWPFDDLVDSDSSDLLKKIREIILKKSGYDIFEEKEEKAKRRKL